VDVAGMRDVDGRARSAKRGTDATGTRATPRRNTNDQRRQLRPHERGRSAGGDVTSAPPTNHAPRPGQEAHDAGAHENRGTISSFMNFKNPS
ncbi:MAG: hypothetical protein QOF86_2454, partial [Baekduia sp.]|nr:hypothetical protein [Baekduia sp.]